MQPLVNSVEALGSLFIMQLYLYSYGVFAPEARYWEKDIYLFFVDLEGRQYSMRAIHYKP